MATLEPYYGRPILMALYLIHIGGRPRGTALSQYRATQQSPSPLSRKRFEASQRQLHNDDGDDRRAIWVGFGQAPWQAGPTSWFSLLTMKEMGEEATTERCEP